MASAWRDWVALTHGRGPLIALANERVAWFDGKIVRESEVMIPFRDQGFLRGDAIFAAGWQRSRM